MTRLQTQNPYIAYGSTRSFTNHTGFYAHARYTAAPTPHVAIRTHAHLDASSETQEERKGGSAVPSQVDLFHLEPRTHA